MRYFIKYQGVPIIRIEIEGIIVLKTMKLLKIIISILLIYISYSIKAQTKSEVFVEAAGIYATPGQLMPLYLYSNNWGVISPFQKSSFWLHIGGHYQFLNKDKIKLKAGLSGIVKNDIEESILHQAYLRGKAFNVIDFTIGKEAYTPISYNDTLTVGGFLNNSNARPVPKVMIGIYEYLPLGFTKNWVEIRGGISHGWLNDDRISEGRGNSADMPYLHEKWAYMRLGNTKIQPYAGLVHNSLMGGTRPNGDKIPVDYFATFLGKGSSKLGGGEETNAAGAHEGFWDFGFYINTKPVDFLAYLQRPFADGSGMKTWEFNNKDFRIGLLVEIKHSSFLEKLSIEFIKTDHQSGPGIPDQLYPEGHEKAGKIIFTDMIDDVDAFMLEVFQKNTVGWTSKELMNYLENQQNFGYEFGGRDDYNNNYSYYNGWTYHQQAFGLPLYHTKYQTARYAPNWDPTGFGIFRNNRIKAFHLGAEGDLFPGFHYIMKYTFSKNYGTYGEQYEGRSSWTERNDFYYESGKNQNYSQLQLAYQPSKINALNIRSSFSFDFGELYQSFGFNLGVRYMIFTVQ